MPTIDSVSVKTSLDELKQRIDEYGSTPFLITSSDDGRPHVVSVQVRVDGDDIVAAAGSTTRSNVAARRAATLLWPSPDGGPYSLIVDGEGRVDDATSEVVVRPTRAVLHLSAGAGDDLATCVRIVDNRR